MAFNNVTESVTNAFQSVGTFIINGIKDIFVPDEEFITEKVNLIKDKFSFIENIKSVWSTVSGVVEDGEPQIPKISIDFSKAENTLYDYGGQMYILDMTWYSRYKPFVDGLIIGFSYLGFAFLVFKRLPEIISGSGAITNKVSKGGN